MAGINKAIILGRLGKNPETRYAQDGSAAIFWSKVDIKESIKECWNWLGAKKESGYGNVRINKKYLLAHRVAWELANFKIPEGYHILHLCDNPSCCNPNHLVLGTNKSNFCDMLFKNRSGFKKNKAIGEKNANSKLTDSLVKKIRDEYPGLNQYQLGEKYNVAQTTIGSIVNFKTWRHVGGRQ